MKNVKPGKRKKFEIVPFSKTKPIKTCKIKNSGKSSKKYKFSKEHNAIELCKSKTNAPEELILNVPFAFTLSDRTQLRREALGDFQIHCNNDELYDKFLKRLIDLEESLINDN